MLSSRVSKGEKIVCFLNVAQELCPICYREIHYFIVTEVVFKKAMLFPPPKNHLQSLTEQLNEEVEVTILGKFLHSTLAFGNLSFYNL